MAVVCRNRCLVGRRICGRRCGHDLRFARFFFAFDVFALFPAPSGCHCFGLSRVSGECCICAPYPPADSILSEPSRALFVLGLSILEAMGVSLFVFHPLLPCLCNCFFVLVLSYLFLANHGCPRLCGTLAQRARATQRIARILYHFYPLTASNMLAHRIPSALFSRRRCPFYWG